MAVAEGGLPPLKGEQRAASAPDAHVWLSASAGTGKTQVLTARVLRLLLAGVDPSTILCITFTKAGAAEMTERLSSRLAGWVRLKDADLARDLKALGEDYGAERIAKARRLFAEVLDVSGGLRIQTIHAFSQALLGSFPLEAGLTPGFRLMDARQEASMIRDTLAAMLAGAEESMVEGLGRLSLRLGEGAAEAFLAQCARAPALIAALPDTGEAVGAIVRAALGVPAGDIEAAICRECAGIDAGALARLAAANRGWGAATGLAQAEVIERWIAAGDADRPMLLTDLVAIVFTAKGEPRKISPRLVAAEADYEALSAAMGERCRSLLNLRALAGYADDLASALWAGRRFAAAYADAKAAAGLLDFDDLIRRAVALLRTPGMGDWVRYKLDQATDHILVDESQDTNAEQWAIVDALAEEYFATAPEDAPKTRTLFTVGDYKQAIFGFQGTDPAEYARAHDHFASAAARASHPFHALSLTHSFRSTRPVLEFVDEVTATIGAAPLGERRLQGHASEVPGPGTVSLWAPVGDADLTDPGEEGWLPDATIEVANRIARQIRAWIDRGMMLESKGRPLRAGDVMILLRKRGELASTIVARLHAEGVPVAGIDRLRLTAPLAVQDLLAAIRFVLQPLDDLNLAALLVSPLLGWSQEDLYRAARRDRGMPLWTHLGQGGVDPERLAPLRMMLARADFVPPYRFLEEILSGELQGRRRLLERLGEEARDPIAELLNAALQFELAETPSLQGFMAWFDRGDVDIVRDPGVADEAVRVMTVHGAKGLQAPLVILADATGNPELSPTARLALPLADGRRIPVFAPRKDERTGAIAAVVEAQEARERAEHWRLLYVAMTRAEERLVIAGALARNRSAAPDESWWTRAALAMEGLPSDTVIEGGGRAERFRGRVEQAPVRSRARSIAAAPVAVAVPDWLRRPAPTEARPPRPLAPSALGIDRAGSAPPGAAERDAAERGRLIHALLERLPRLDPSAREEAARRWLAHQGAADVMAADVSATVARVMADPAHAGLFGADGLAEAPIAAVLADGTVVSGVVDRLVVEDDRVRVIDYKTGRVPPAPGAVPDYHLRQMAAYAAALAVIFPGRRIEAGLLYTATPVLLWLPELVLASHKPGFTTTEQSLAPTG